jgi:hypothetical protein
MDGTWLDRLARDMTRAEPRRSILGGASGLVAALLLPRQVFACKKLGKTCSKDKDCCDGAKCKHDKCKCKTSWKDCDGDGKCEDLDADNDNCGACGATCPFLQACCDGVCVDVTSDPENCGFCGNACDANETCCRSRCVDLQSDHLNCGACGNECATSSDQCIDGVCTPFICTAGENHCFSPTSYCNSQIGCHCLERSSNGKTRCAMLSCGFLCDDDADCSDAGAGAFCASGGDFCCTGANGHNVCAVPCTK